VLIETRPRYSSCGGAVRVKCQRTPAVSCRYWTRVPVHSFAVRVSSRDSAHNNTVMYANIEKKGNTLMELSSKNRRKLMQLIICRYE